MHVCEVPQHRPQPPAKGEAELVVNRTRRGASVAANYDDTRRRKTGRFSAAGPGRGHRGCKAKRSAAAKTSLRQLSTVQALMDSSASTQEIRLALRKESEAHRHERNKHAGTKRKLAQVSRHMDMATALLMKEHHYGNDSDADKKRRVAITEICGEGFSELDGRYFRKKKATVMAFIRDQVGTDVRKQMELCVGLMKQFSIEDPAATKAEVVMRGLSKEARRKARREMKATKKAQDAKDEMVEIVMSGLLLFFDELKDEYAGRYPHHARVAQQAVSTAIMPRASHRMASMIAKLWGV